MNTGPNDHPGTDSQAAMFGRQTHNNWIRLKTLILLRWVAIVGQMIAVFAAATVYDLDLRMSLLVTVIGVSILVNLLSAYVFSDLRRLSESQAAKMLLFDILQLSVLLWLTGGLNNPFAILIVAPVTISAAALSLRSTVSLAILAVCATSLLTQSFLPLSTRSGVEIAIPEIFVFGFWIAIVTGIAFMGIYAYRVSSEQHSMSEALLATQMALSREQKLTDLGGVIAAAAHELGTPLATIKIASAELAEELASLTELRPELREDAELIRNQADRCREILRSMGRAGKSDLLVLTAPLEAVIREAADPHIDRAKTVHFDMGRFDTEHLDAGQTQHTEPEFRRMPEVIHGLRNLIQNAVDFAVENVWIETRWRPDGLLVRVLDDGPGYPSDMLGRIGDPFVRRRQGAKKLRPEYEGMGLGLFIAKTLLERSGARLNFSSGSDPFLLEIDRHNQYGAIVEVWWPLNSLPFSSHPQGIRPALGANRPLEE